MYWFEPEHIQKFHQLIQREYHHETNGVNFRVFVSCLFSAHELLREEAYAYLSKHVIQTYVSWLSPELQTAFHQLNQEQAIDWTQELIREWKQRTS